MTDDDQEHGWVGTRSVATSLGAFDFANSYPLGDAPGRLRDALVYCRAVEAYLLHLPTVAQWRVWEGLNGVSQGAVIIWETLMDAQTLVLTGNCETVYAMATLDLSDGPVVVESPAGMLGLFTDSLQGEVVAIGFTGPDKGQGGNFVILPPDFDGTAPDGYFAATSATYRVVFFIRGFLVDGKPDDAVALMKQAKVYPLAQAGDPPETRFMNGSRTAIDTLFVDDSRYFDDLAEMIENEPGDIIPSHERFLLASIGIEKGKPFNPSAERRDLLEDAARLASSIARANTFASNDPERLVYPDRAWEWMFVGHSATWDSQGYVNTDRRAGFAYAAAGMSPAMVERHVGAGSQYIWTPRDADRELLVGDNIYRLHIPPDIPAKNFWSVVAYDAASRSMIKSDQPFPSVSTFTEPDVNDDGSIDIHFGPTAPEGAPKNWIQTLPGRGWFVIFRFYGPLEPFFDLTWRPDDIRLVSP